MTNEILDAWKIFWDEWSNDPKNFPKDESDMCFTPTFFNFMDWWSKHPSKDKLEALKK